MAFSGRNTNSNINGGMLMFMVMFVMAGMSTMCSSCNLTTTFYDETCPSALSAIRTVIRKAVSKERRMAASLIRLHFHDCFVQGCDASILLISGGERTAPPNNNSVRGYEVIDEAKAAVEKICPGVVSCADIVSVAARDASVAVGGPSWPVELGRRDSTTGNPGATTDLPAFSSNLTTLIANFKKKGLSTRQMVALSGAHTIGLAQCFTFRARIYGNTSTVVDDGFASTRRRRCPASGGNTILAPLDLVSPTSFDNNYFKNLLQNKGLLASDQVLFNGDSTDSIVLEYSKSPATFASDFAAAMVKMGEIEVLTGSQGEIRKICSAVN